MDGNSIQKELFHNENYDVKQTVNSILSSNSNSESDLINFKLKILQREFGNEIDLNMNNLLKFSKTLENDIKQTELSNNLLISTLTNNKNINNS